MAKSKTDAPDDLTLDELIEAAVGKEGTVRQPGKGAWLDPQTKEPRLYVVVGAAEPEEGVFTLSLESVDRAPRFVTVEQRVHGHDGLVLKHIPDGFHPHAAQVVPNCPLKWFKPIPPAAA